MSPTNISECSFFAYLHQAIGNQCFGMFTFANGEYWGSIIQMAKSTLLWFTCLLCCNTLGVEAGEDPIQGIWRKKNSPRAVLFLSFLAISFFLSRDCRLMFSF